MIKKRNPTQAVKDLDSQWNSEGIKPETERNYQEHVIEEVEVEEEELDFGGDLEETRSFEQKRENIYENMKLRPLDLAILAG